ncbi:hypothetical protein H7X68_01735 [Candidatus Saccharibacteria bacterium]|nr:hypothetical protein [Candidatus Saccharibacteria bacterium]
MSHHDNQTVKVINRAGPTGFVFFLAYIGAAIYFVEQSSGGFWEVVLALLQAAVWPVFVMYHVLQNFGV